MAPALKEKEKKTKRVGKRAAAKAAAEDPLADLSESTQKLNLENNRSSTGVLTSEKNSRDVKVRNKTKLKLSLYRLNCIPSVSSPKFLLMKVQLNLIMAVVMV
jgi:hypothetical protein